MKSRITKLATAAVIMIAAVVAGRAGYRALTTDYVASGASTIEQSVAESALIVRVEFLEKTDAKSTMEGRAIKRWWNMRVKKVLSGEVDGDVINVLTREFVEYPMKHEAGMEVIMFLEMRDGQYRPSRTVYGNQRRSLDTKEEEILRAIKGDNNLSVCGDISVTHSSTSVHEDGTKAELIDVHYVLDGESTTARS